jgi:hypothetical protein
VKFYNLARVSTSTTGTGTITLGSAISGFLTFANAGVQDGDTVAYGISDGSSSEVGTGVYSSTGPTLTRSVTTSTNGNAAINLSGSAQVYITARAEDVRPGIPTVQTFTSGSGTYTTPANCLWLEVRMVGGGAGGQGSGTTGQGTGTSGGNTTFGSSFLTATGGAHSMGAGGTGTIASPAYGQTFTGGRGSGLTGNTPAGLQAQGGDGGTSMFGGAGGGTYDGAGTAAAANSGSGGGGGGTNTTANNYSGGGGSAGGGVIAIVPSPSASYAYSVGSGGSGGAAGTNGYAGGAGGSGFIIVTEYYS